MSTKFGALAGVLLAAIVAAGCGSGSSTPVILSITPTTATAVRTGTQQFSASVAGISNTLVNWDVCNPAPTAIATGQSNVANIVMPTGCVQGGNTTLGAITTNGLYTAPTILPPNSQVSIVAISQAKTTVFAIVNVTIDSGVRVSLTPASVSIGTSEQFQFSVTVTGDPNTAVSWSVNGTANGNTTVGTIVPVACTVPMPITPSSSNPIPPGTSFGCYTAPATPQSSVSIAATAAADTKQVGTATVNVLAATDPLFSTTKPLEPTAADEGSVQQDLYLFGSNFFSTNQVLVNGSPVPTTFVNSTTLRATIPGTFFSGPVSAPGLPITIQRQNGDTSATESLVVQPARPSVIASSPESFPTTTTSATLTVNGGYFSSSTLASSQGSPLSLTVANSRQLQVGISNSAFFSTAGLQPILIQNSDVTTGPATAFTNVAIAPSAANIPSSPSSTIAVGTQPVAIGVDEALGVAAIVDQGSNQVSLLNLDTNSVGSASVGNVPTSVSVDDILHIAAIVNSADNSLSVVNLQTQAVSTVPLPSNPTGTAPAPSPFGIGVNSLTHRAVIAYSSSNIATVFDLSTNPPSLVCTLGGSNPNMPNNCSTISGSNTRPVSTGPAPSIAVEPKLNWAIITPGGSGTISIVDLGGPATANQVARAPNVVASFQGISSSIRGVAINTETEESLLVDPNSARASVFSMLDETMTPFSSPQGFVAAAVNPLTDVGVAVNSPGNSASVFDLRSHTQIGSSVAVGASPQAVAIDAGKNEAVVANSGDNTVSILSLGPILTPQITEVSPGITFAAPSAGALNVTVNGFGFASGAQVRLDGSATGITTTVSANGRQAVATIPGSLLSAARRFALDVQNASGASSNIEQFLVMGAVPIGLNPIGVAVDPDLNEALVTSQGAINSPQNTCTSPGSVSVVSLVTATVANSFGVGSCPEGVAVIPRLGLGVVANNDSQNASVLDYVNGNITATVSVGLDPVGVAIVPDSAEVLVTNSSSNSVSTFAATSTSTTSNGNINVDQVPFGVGVDYVDGIAGVTSSNQNNLDAISVGPNFLAGRVSGFHGPSDVAFDPIADLFLVADSLANQIGVVDPKATVAGLSGFTPFRVGINPTSLAYNFQNGTGVTFNGASNSFSIFNFVATNPNSQLTIQASQVEAVLPVGGSAAFSVAINPLTNVAAVVDQANGRLLLVPLP